jgi:molybdopterin-guanine dinucleotide biosynthesis adapter protein
VADYVADYAADFPGPVFDVNNVPAIADFILSPGTS